MNQSQNPKLSYRPDGGVRFKQRMLGWLHGNVEEPNELPVISSQTAFLRTQNNVLGR
jgi:hypothetical protein